MAHRRPSIEAGPVAPSAAAKHTASKLSYLTVYRASPLERILVIKKGIPASEAKRLFVDLATLLP